jgi:hypothetical protein
MPKGHSTLEPRIAALEALVTERTEAMYNLINRVDALERRIAQMDDAFSRGNLPAPRGHQTLAVQ